MRSSILARNNLGAKTATPISWDDSALHLELLYKGQQRDGVNRSVGYIELLTQGPSEKKWRFIPLSLNFRQHPLESIPGIRPRHMITRATLEQD